ncbi:MAG: hypothetical protein K2N10_00495 [Muribaculaceae bacterium]|nr:hypothetical protein [Muribaculaceae bacterium]
MRKTLYSSALRATKGAVAAVGTLPGAIIGSGKTSLFLRGQKQALSAAGTFKPGPLNFWFHCASLGEYAIARPLMAEIKRRRHDARIALTFFSSTGVEALKRRPNPDADFVGYLPLDTPANARKLCDCFRPSAALFMVSEYWPNYLAELKARRIPTYLVSCIFTEKAPHFSPVFGPVFRRSLQAYTRIFCLSQNSVSTLAKLGFDRAEVEGDPLVDNALRIAETPWHSPELHNFCTQGPTLICGSIHNGADLDLIAPEINAHPERRYLLVPHEVDSASLNRVRDALDVPCRLLSDYIPSMPERVLIVDSVGLLAYIYRLGTMAYVGGGFSRQLHSVLEPAVYGLPIAFGPRTERKVVARLLLKLGTATKTQTPEEFSAWADRYFNAPTRELAEIRRLADKFCHHQAGATSRIISTVLAGL